MEIARVAIAALLAAAVPASAQTFRQDVVVTAAAVPIEIGMVTRTLTVISKEQIARLPVSSIADVLRLVPAVDVRSRGVRGMQTDFAVRGANFGQVLVLVDGVRLNDAQSGHHNGDIPVPLDAVERIEILHGAGSSLFGADAFGGTINIVTRESATTSGEVHAGSFGTVGGRAQTSLSRGATRQLVSLSAERSGGFMFERQYATAEGLSRTAFGDKGELLVASVWKDFGANGFYGNAPSHEWTNQILAAGNRRFSAPGGWLGKANVAYRTHGDHFLFDVRRPGFAENRHRTHAATGSLSLMHPMGRGFIVTGGEVGSDWIRSSNLGDHTTTRISGFADWRRPLSQTSMVDVSLRADRYSEFGTAISPAVGITWWKPSGLRFRASGGRAFRVPTFTERYYSDPANWARPEVGAETSWSAETGVDLFLPEGWQATATVYARFDKDAIDWLRPSVTERWRTYNVRSVETGGIELSVRRSVAAGAFTEVGYTYVDVNAAAVTQLSKYVLDYAPHTLVAAGSVAIRGGLFVAPRLEYRHRTRASGNDDYAVLDLRVSRAFGRFEVRLDGANLGNAAYQEITGVAMPGRSATVALVVGR